MSIEHLVFNQGPKRVGPFSHAVKAGDFLFVTGQMPTLPNDPTKLIEGGISNQTHQVMKNLENLVNKCEQIQHFQTRILLHRELVQGSS